MPRHKQQFTVRKNAQFLPHCIQTNAATPNSKSKLPHHIQMNAATEEKNELLLPHQHQNWVATELKISLSHQTTKK